MKALQLRIAAEREKREKSIGTLINQRTERDNIISELREQLDAAVKALQQIKDNDGQEGFSAWLIADATLAKAKEGK